MAPAVLFDKNLISNALLDSREFFRGVKRDRPAHTWITVMSLRKFCGLYLNIMWYRILIFWLNMKCWRSCWVRVHIQLAGTIL